MLVCGVAVEDGLLVFAGNLETLLPSLQYLPRILQCLPLDPTVLALGSTVLAPGFHST